MQPAVKRTFKHKLEFICFLVFIFILMQATSSVADPKGVEGYVITPRGGGAYNTSMRIHVTASVGIGLSIPCTTVPPVYSDAAGYYITNLANLKRDDNGNDCGNLWFTGDEIWAVANGSTTSPFPYTSANSSHTAIPDVSGVTMSVSNATLLNDAPELASLSAPAVNGGNSTTITPIGHNDRNGDNLSIFCCFDTSNSCTPTIAGNQCGGNWENVSYPYTSMNCTYTAPSGVETYYYARCGLQDYGNQTGITSTSFAVDSDVPITTDDYANNNTWVNSDQTVTINADCSLVACNWTYYCTENDTCAPYINYSTPIVFSDENLSYLRYQTQDILGKTDDIKSYIIKIDEGPPLRYSASVTIENDSIILTNTTVNFNWSDFSDNLSGIRGYYYNFTNNEGTASGLFDADSPGVLTNSPQGLVYVYVWAVDEAGNIGLAVNDSIRTDSEGPNSSIYNISEDYGGDFTYYNSPTTTFCYADQAAGFTVQINATDQNGLDNATGSSAFGDSPIDTTSSAGDYQFELSYTIEAPTPVVDSINITVSDNLSNAEVITLNLLKDTSSPGNASITSDYDFWNPNADVDFSWNASFDQCGVQEYFWNVDNGANTTTASVYANTSGSSEGNHTFYLYATDNMANTGIVGSYSFGVDTTAPSAPGNLRDQQEFDNDGSFTLVWDSVSDISGITYEIFENDNSTGWHGIQNTTSTTLDISGRLDWHNYSYFVRARNGAGLLSGNSTPTDGILVDTTNPYITDVNSEEMNHTNSGSLTVNSTAGDSVSGFNITPAIEYRYGSDAWSPAYDMSLITGNSYAGNYTYDVPEPGSGWAGYRGQQAYWNITVTDKAGNTNETQYSTTVTSINRLAFSVTDRIVGLSLNDTNISGGTQCASGCLFNGSINISEPNGNYSFRIERAGFTANTTEVSVTTEDLEFNVTLDDATSPTISFMNYSLSAASSTTFYAKVYANISENLNIDRAFVNYTITEYFSDSGEAEFTYVSGTVYSATLGPYNSSFFMNPNIFVNDSYGLSDSQQLTDVWYVFGNGTGGTVSYVAGDDVLALQEGWNLISVPFLENHTAESVLAGLSNGNWGCGRDGAVPVVCNESAGDFAGNFTKIMAYNESDSTWIAFNPTDYYLSIDDEDIDDIEAKKGYWINMTRAQNLVLDLKFD